MSRSASRERLRRLLLIVPYVSRHPGVPIVDLAAHVGVSPQELLKDLALLNQVGRPPFDPSDLIELEFEEGRCTVALDQRFSRPPTLTLPEAAALWACAELTRPAAKSALASAQQKLETALPEQARRDLVSLSRQFASDGGALEALLEPLAEAIHARREVTLAYRPVGKEETEHRTVRPESLDHEDGQWYLSAFCLLRGARRRFRVDRILAVEPSERTFDAPPDTPSAKAEERAVVRFSAREAPWIRERFTEGVADLPDGGVTLTLPRVTKGWVVSFVLSFAGEAEVTEPPGFREATSAAAARLLLM